MAERDSTFWNSLELGVNILDPVWNKHVMEQEKDFGMDSSLGNNIESRIGCSLTIVGP